MLDKFLGSIPSNMQGRSTAQHSTARYGKTSEPNSDVKARRKISASQSSRDTKFAPENVRNESASTLTRQKKCTAFEFFVKLISCRTSSKRQLGVAGATGWTSSVVGCRCIIPGFSSLTHKLSCICTSQLSHSNCLCVLLCECGLRCNAMVWME